ncbi:uncharacterized protein SCHCODRAFT_02602676 [Schizophyllum commune H4-8]|uniref:Uncharacterized protein n=1 Tax=Schizophyllum commune (strain H4-8 / FGSC 9210) TaxID=578458 RepID=D8QH04_SCHCM|nr:uncharacterized protein SCHCODRAFT_02602676 [Schizophyllum commune H4-8]KAI5886967.1 hypothetical protein SCHCODRAFT_02602676 [Schizophyllum commune H4-8]
MSPSILSSSVSTQKDMDALPIVNYRLINFDSGLYRRQIEHFEYYWGLQRGEIDLSSPLNHVQLRSDMAERMDRSEWALLPTKRTIDTINALSEYNKSADLHERKRFTEELPEQEYEYEFVPLHIAKRDRPSIYLKRGSTSRSINKAYSKMPRIKSHAHPLFVIFRADSLILTGSPSLPKVKKERLSTRASESGSSNSDTGTTFSAVDLREWLSSISPAKTKRAPPPSPGRDAVLGRYRKEPARAPANALRVSTFYVFGGLVGGVDDGNNRAVYSSNDWARHNYRTCLWADSQRRSTGCAALRRPYCAPPCPVAGRSFCGCIAIKADVLHGGKNYQMSSSVWLRALSTQQDMDALPIVSFRLVDLDAGLYRRQLGELDLATPLNHIEREWTLVATKQVLDSISRLVEVNSKLLPEKVYEYEFVPLTLKDYSRLPLYVDDGTSVKKMRAPYAHLPRIKSRAHPLFVAFCADTRFTSYETSERSKVGRLAGLIDDIIHPWRVPPPLEFVIVPDIWKPHRHPLSDDGSEARAALKTVNHESPRQLLRALRRSARAPYPTAKAPDSKPSIYDYRLKPTCPKSAVLPRSVLSGQSDVTDGRGAEYIARDVQPWLDDVCREADGDTGDLDDDENAQSDAYEREVARDPENALKPTKFTSIGRVLKCGAYVRDRSGYSSNDWALYLYRKCLWSSKPPSGIY